MTITTVNDTNFEKEVLEAEGPVLVYFWATWCAPCKAMGPSYEQAAIDNPGAKFCKIDIEASPLTTSAFMVRSLPTIIMFKGGQVHNTLSGLVSPKVLKELAES